MSKMEFCNLCRKHVQLRPNSKSRRKSHRNTKKHKLNAKYYSENNDFDLVGCRYCGFDDDDSNQLVCDLCESQFHMYCLHPPLSGVPKGDWACPICVKFALKNPKHDVAIALNNLNILETSQDTICSGNSVKKTTSRKRKAAFLLEGSQSGKEKRVTRKCLTLDPSNTTVSKADQAHKSGRPIRRKQKPSKYRISPQSDSPSRKQSRKAQSNHTKAGKKRA